jgi:hypothetical protein
VPKFVGKKISENVDPGNLSGASVTRKAFLTGVEKIKQVSKNA